MRSHRLQVTPLQAISRFSIWVYGRWHVWRSCQVEVTGLEYLPRSGPVLIAARHYHHLYDAAVLLATLPRPLHFVVALDWARTRRARWLLEWACFLTIWPGLLRADHVSAASGTMSAWQSHEVEPYARRCVTESVKLLTAGRTLVICPEGSPAIDPERPNRPPESLLPFQHGFVTIARLAARTCEHPIPVVPLGLMYRQAGTRWQVQVRIGAPVLVWAHASRGDTVRTIEAAVRQLSGL